MSRLTEKGETNIGSKRSFRKVGRERFMPCNLVAMSGLKEHVSRYLFASKYAENHTCLDIACGSGYGSNILAKAGATAVVGGDISPEGIEYANRNYTRDNVHFQLMDAQQLPFEDNSFDIIVSFETIEHLEKYEDFLAECKRVLKNGGIFICSTPNKAKYSPYSKEPEIIYHTKEFYIDEFHALIREYFGEIAIYGQEFVRKDIKSNLYLLATHKILPFIRSLPKGEPFTNFFIRIIRRNRKYAILEEIDEEELSSIESNIAPYPQPGKEPIHTIVVAKKK